MVIDLVGIELVNKMKSIDPTPFLYSSQISQTQEENSNKELNCQANVNNSNNSDNNLHTSD